MMTMSFKMRTGALVVLVLIVLCGMACADVLPTNSITLTTTSDAQSVIFRLKINDENFDDQLWLHNVLGTTPNKIMTCASDGKTKGNAWSDSPSISDDGVKLAFHSWATNLLPGTQSCANVFLKDTRTNVIQQVRDHALAPVISGNGKFIAYEYNADPAHDLPAIYRYEIATGEELFIDFTSAGNTKGGWYIPNPLISDDGLTIIYHTTRYSGMPQTYKWTWGGGISAKPLHNGVVTGEEQT
jgi:Tol biopolymer transport system component